MKRSLTAEVTENPPEYFISSASYGLVYKDKPLCVKGTELSAGGGGLNLCLPLLCFLTKSQGTLAVEVANKKRFCAPLGACLIWIKFLLAKKSPNQCE